MTITAWRGSKCNHYRVAALLSSWASRREIIGGKFAAPRKLSSDFLIYRSSLVCIHYQLPFQLASIAIIVFPSLIIIPHPHFRAPAPALQRFIVSFSSFHVNGNRLLCAVSAKRMQLSTASYILPRSLSPFSLHYHRIVIFFWYPRAGAWWRWEMIKSFSRANFSSLECDAMLMLMRCLQMQRKVASSILHAT